MRRAFEWPEDWNIKRMAEYCADPANGLWAATEPSLIRA